MKERILNALMILVVLVCLGITLNSRAPEQAPVLSLDNTFAPAAASPTPHPLDACRAERDHQRQEAMHSLLWLSQDASAGLQSQAQSALLTLQTTAETETAAESLLTAMGYPANVCILQKDGMLLFTQTAVEEKDIALILQSAADLSGLPAEKIRLMTP